MEDKTAATLQCIASSGRLTHRITGTRALTIHKDQCILGLLDRCTQRATQWPGNLPVFHFGLTSTNCVDPESDEEQNGDGENEADAGIKSYAHSKCSLSLVRARCHYRLLRP